jgi:spoIIIJ-associated protein
LLERISTALGLGAAVHVEEEDREIRGTLAGEDLGLFIGRHGQTIDAVQHLAFKAATRDRPPSSGVRVVIDAAGYRERRESSLQRMADRAVAEALRYDRPVELEPMRAPERKLVHLYLRERTEVDTHSEGDEPDRRLVVTPVRSSRDG